MKLFSSIFLFLFLASTVSAQFDATWGYINAKQVDSLKLAVKSELNDTLNMAAFRKLGFYYAESDDDTTIYFHQRQLELAVKLKLQIWEADAYSQIAEKYRTLGNIKKAYEYFIKAINIAIDEKSERPNWEVRSFSNAQNYHEARITTLGMTYIMFGNLYRGINLPEKAKQTYLKALELGKSINNGKIISFYYLNTQIYVSIDSVFIHLQNALKWANSSGYYIQKGWIYNAIGRRYLQANQLDSAKVYAFKAIESSRQQNINPALISSMVLASNIYSNENKLDSAFFYAKEALMVANSNRNFYLAYVYVILANAFALVNNTDSAYVYESLARNLNDSLRRVQLNRMTDYQKVLFEEELKSNADKNKLKLFALIAGLVIVLIVAFILYRNNRQKQNANKALESTLSNLKSTQSQLIHAEKMASLGELTAGIAHEIQNPLNFVNNFSEVNLELIGEADEVYQKGNHTEVKTILNDIKGNEQKISEHGKRADAIVKGMLQHSRSSSGVKESTDVNALADEYLRLSYHGLRAKDKSFNADFKLEADEDLPQVNAVPQEIGRVLLNLINNAFHAVSSKASSTEDSTVKASATKGNTSVTFTSDDGTYKPTVIVSTKNLGDQIEIRVKDNGNGIPEEIKDKIFQPFFTTKPAGQGTGLGLSMSYDIITKGHGGKLKIETKEGEGSEFIIQLPL
ncbi:MAG: ATP-binding protein [Bacteroidales bacterium]